LRKVSACWCCGIKTAVAEDNKATKSDPIENFFTPKSDNFPPKRQADGINLIKNAQISPAA